MNKTINEISKEISLPLNRGIDSVQVEPINEALLNEVGWQYQHTGSAVSINRGEIFYIIPQEGDPIEVPAGLTFRSNYAHLEGTEKEGVPIAEYLREKEIDRDSILAIVKVEFLHDNTMGRKFKRHQNAVVYLPMVLNFSRHSFSSDQRAALKSLGLYGEEGARSPFFKDALDLANQIQGKTVSLVAPMGLLLEAMASDVPLDATIIVWAADEAARKRGRFAFRQVTIYRISKEGVRKVASIPWEPRVEVDFKTGEEFPYGEEVE